VCTRILSDDIVVVAINFVLFSTISPPSENTVSRHLRSNSKNLLAIIICNMMLITGQHRILFSMLKKLRLGEEMRLKNKTVNLFDFGARIKIIVSLAKGKTQIELQVTFQEDYEIHNEAIEYLRMLYGPSVGFTRFDDQHKVVISITPNEAVARFDSPHRCAMSLSQIRVQAAGAPILKALNRMNGRCPNQDFDENTIHKLGSHGNCGTYHCISTDEK
jgi:hypothetical protein